MPDTSHLDESAVARYVGGTATPAERAEIEAHVVACDDCREDLIAVRDVLKIAKRRRVTRVMKPAGAAAAAAAVLLVVMTSIDRGGRFESIVRGSPLATHSAPVLLYPIDTVVRLDSVRWHAVAGALRYRVVISAEDARPVFQAVVNDTSIAIPRSLRFTPLAHYYWRVESEMRVGHWEGSAPASFWWNALNAPR